MVADCRIPIEPPDVLYLYHPYLPFCRHIIPTLHFIFFRKCFWDLFLLIKLYPYNYLTRECGLYKAGDLLLGDLVCEKSDAVK